MNETKTGEIRPSYYSANEKIECWDAIQAATGEHFPAFLVGNVMKYLWRYADKDGASDLRKAYTYMRKLMQVSGLLDEG